MMQYPKVEQEIVVVQIERGTRPKVGHLLYSLIKLTPSWSPTSSRICRSTRETTKLNTITMEEAIHHIRNQRIWFINIITTLTIQESILLYN